MSNLAYSIIYPQPRKLTLGVVLALTLFSLTVNAQDPLDPNASVVRYNSNGEITASGDDIGAVQNAPRAAEGDVIKVSDGAAFNIDVTNPVSGFTIESSTGNVVNVPVQAGYNFPQIPAAPVNAAFRNVSFTSADSYTSNFWRGDLNQNDIIGITIDGKVSFSNFKNSVFSYTGTLYYPYKFTCTSGSSLTFSGNTTADYGAAIVHLSELNASNSSITFSNNAIINGDYPMGGAIFILDDLSGNNNNLTFSGNTVEDGEGGAIGELTDLSGSYNKLTFSNNKANRVNRRMATVGGAIRTLDDLTGSYNTLEFTGNTADIGGALGYVISLTGSNNTLGFSDNTALCGGAIDAISNFTGNNNTLTFSNNIANCTDIPGVGGAIEFFSVFSGSSNILEFDGNIATNSGGAIHRFNLLSGENNTLTFSNNKANGTGNTDGGGAIYNLTNFSGSGNTLDFSENTAAESGGAIRSLTDLTGNNNQLTFSNNKANGTDNEDGGGAIYQLDILSGSGNTLKFEGNTAEEGDGGAIWNLTNFSGSGNTLEFSENTAAKSGGAIYRLGNSDGTLGLTGNNNTLTFTGNTARIGGGAIRTLVNLTGNNNKLTFSKNTANGPALLGGGGAIWRLAFLSGSGNILEFSENTAESFGGAIYDLYELSGSGNTLEFTENTAEKDGGAIHTLFDLAGNNNTLKFSGNTAIEAGGAIGLLMNLSGSGNTLEFTGNTAEEGDGGAINTLMNLPGSGNTLDFSENTTKGYGGAIGYLGYLNGNNNTLTFTGNTAGVNGGAIGNLYLNGSGNTLIFTGNTAGEYGGAIYSLESIEFSGNNTLTFTGNKAGTKGNDIYLYGYNNSPANLTFSGGTYSFDGGIWLAEYNGQTGTTTISNGAKVTIAGRNDDSVNEYEFRDVALTANLTATLDEIEYLHGNFTVGENGLMTIKKGSDTATIKSSSPDGGVFDLLINKAEEVETISISSGRIDIKGCIDATIELQNDATFSPGNSVGHVDIDGAFILNAGTTLLIEMDATGIDTMAATSFDLDNGTISFTLSDEIPGGATYDILTAKNGTPFDEDIITRMLNGQTLPEYYTLALAGPSNNIVRFSIDRNAVPEPSTWALLILGAAGLAYMRKRK